MHRNLQFYDKNSSTKFSGKLYVRVVDSKAGTSFGFQPRPLNVNAYIATLLTRGNADLDKTDNNAREM